ncbi:hypothetical protein [Rhodoflexus caldus]|uniref:hypothetical protein n=1 Tax=Rhodoflexus caldus TaxID=2891236 RepID=UPI00202A1B35|nr:hypothetical protein [Rhodoflexus caldus]
MEFVYPIVNPTDQPHVIRVGGGGLIPVEDGNFISVNFTREPEGSATGYMPAADLPDGILLSTHFTFTKHTCPELQAQFVTQIPQPSLPSGWRFGIAIADADTTVSISDFEQVQSAVLPYQIVSNGSEVYEYSRLSASPKLLTNAINYAYFIRFPLLAERENLEDGKTYRLYFFAVGEWQMTLFSNPAFPNYPLFVNPDAVLPPAVSEQIGRDAKGCFGANARLIEELIIKADNYRDMPIIRVIRDNTDGSSTVRQIHLPPSNDGAQVASVELHPEEAVLNIGYRIEFIAPPNSSFQIQGKASASLAECLLCIMRQMSKLQKQGKLCIN